MTSEPTSEPSSEPTAESTPLVVVSVGTDHHRFDRLVGWMDAWAVSNRSVRVIVQRGTAASTTAAESQPLVPHGELCALFREATAVVTHGGPSTVMDARAAGRLPIVVPRDPELGEHVDDHQLAFAEHLRRHGLAIVVENVGELDDAIRRAIDSPDAAKVSADVENAAGIAGFSRVLDELLAPRKQTVR
ncbi:MAG: glycosyltransferase [Acidimicrobiales bacterium]